MLELSLLLSFLPFIIPLFAFILWQASLLENPEEGKTWLAANGHLLPPQLRPTQVTETTTKSQSNTGEMSQPYKRPRLSSVKLLDFDVTLRSSASFTDPRVGSSQAIKLGGKTIEILVGESKSAYYVHEQVICSSSEFFRNAMKPEWAERKENPRQIELLDENGAMFEFYMQWLYSKKLPTLDNQAWVRPGHTHQHHGEFTHLARAYVLGEKLLDNDFKNTLIDAMIAMTLSDSTEGRYYPRGSPIKIIYDGTPESSPARRLLVDFWVWRADERWLDATDQVPEDFHHDLLRGLLSSRARLHGTKPWADFPETYYS